MSVHRENKGEGRHAEGDADPYILHTVRRTHVVCETVLGSM
ncbi:hypothetical protein F01_380055 [Burkholderia cenocepacia]|nr:hypothetical protein F01_380055 [Burkholderia cenocepacia]